MQNISRNSLFISVLTEIIEVSTVKKTPFDSPSSGVINGFSNRFSNNPESYCFYFTFFVPPVEKKLV